MLIVDAYERSLTCGFLVGWGENPEFTMWAVSSAPLFSMFSHMSSISRLSSYKSPRVTAYDISLSSSSHPHTPPPASVSM